MEMTGERRIPAPRESVWQALNDPEVLKRCIPGCEELEKTSDTSFAAKVKAKVGPVSAKFQGAVTLSDINPPESYTISGEGKGGAAGFAKGGAKVRLDEDGDATRLSYDVQAQVGGKLAQIGSRLIDGTAKKMADDFFGKFAAEFGPVEEVAAPSPAAEAEMAAAAMAGAAPLTAPGGHAAPSDAELNKDVGKGVRPGMWVAGLIIVVILLLLIFGLG